MTKSYTQKVVFQPRTYRGIQRGIDKIANAIRPTLGPRPRIVAIDRMLDEKMPELLDDGGTIAKRIIELPGRDEDVGAMFIRDVLWELRNQAGDGTATTAVMFQKIYSEGVRYITAGGNGTRLQAYLQKGLESIIDHLDGITIQVSGKGELARVAETICYDPPLAKLLGEIFEIIGEYGRLEIREGRGRDLEREYVEGMYWERGLVSREMIVDHTRLRTEFENGAILISDLEIEEPDQLFPALELALRAKIGELLIVANKFSDKTIGFLLANKKPDQFQVIAVQTPGWGKEEQAGALEDLAVLTGGRPFIKVAGDRFDQIKVEDFGYARRVWADHRNFGIVGGKGDPRSLRRHIANLRAAYKNTDEIVAGEKLLKRIGKLLGGSATLWIGGSTELQIAERLEIAKRTAAAMRGAMMEGVVPGGGVALMSCRPMLQQRVVQSSNPDERAAYRILTEAVAEPLRTIVDNAGYEASQVLGQLNRMETAYGFDVISGEVVDVRESGLLDAASVQKAAIHAAVASAGLALTIDVLVHRNGQPSRARIEGPGKRKRL